MESWRSLSRKEKGRGDTRVKFPASKQCKHKEGGCAEFSLASSLLIEGFDLPSAQFHRKQEALLHSPAAWRRNAFEPS
jgi:hypothetical protein